MNPLAQSPYRDITPEELHEAMRRAHVERSKAIGELLAGLLAWRRRVADRAQAATLKTAAGH